MADLTDDDFDRFVDKAINDADATFAGPHGAALKALLGISEAEIDAITPGTTDLETYEKLMAIVRMASQKNISQAQLIDRIKGMGEVAVAIAKKVPKWAALL